MNRVLLLLLSVISFHLSGPFFLPEISTLSNSTFKHSYTPKPAQLAHNQPRNSADFLMDTIPPVITCAANDTIQLQPGRCDTVLHYTVSATDDQGAAIVIQLSGLSSGSVFPKGVNTIVYLATDLAGNTATCSFALTVDDEWELMLVCDDQLEVELDANCTRTVIAQEFMQGGPYGCWDRYVVAVDKTIPFGNGPWLPAVMGAADHGKTYQGRVTDTETGNKCWGNIKVSDKTGPVLDCQTITISCAENNLTPEFLRDSLGIAAAVPVANDFCSPVTFLGHTDQNLPNNCDSTFSGIVKRQWQANDSNGNSSTCIQNIQKHRHTLDELQLPPDVTLSCPDTAVSPDQTGFPYLIYQGRRYDLENSSICYLSVFYEDHPLRLPCGDLKIRRLWEYFDFCLGISVGPFQQNIYVLDQTSPTIACPASLLVSLNADTCFALVNLPDALLDDVCTSLASFEAFWEVNGLAKSLVGSMGDFPGNNLSDNDTMGIMGTALLPVGTTTISYVTEDSCGNIGDCTFNLTVADMVSPIAKCDTFSVLQLLPDGSLSAAANAFDNGSSDACSTPNFKVRFLATSACLYDTIWTDSLRFCCLNIQDTLDAKLRVYDIPVPVGDVSANFGTGHFSDCAMKITIQDPNPPSCLAPQNLTVNCEDFDPTLQSYGLIAATSCAVDSIAMEVDYSQFDTLCHFGTLTRIFKVFDAAGNIGGCAQAVQVNYLQDYFIKFPDDAIVTSCDGTGNLGQEPVFFGEDCEQFDVTYTDEIFNVVPDACYKIERTWKISNRCTYDSSKPLILIPNPNPNAVVNHPTNLPGPIVSACNALPPWSPSIVKILPTDPGPTNYCEFWRDTANGYQYKQIIKVIDGQAPNGIFTVSSCANQTWTTSNNPQLWNETYWNEPVFGTHDLAEEPTELSIEASDACSGSNINIEYLLFLDMDANGSTETVINSVNTEGNGLGWNRVLYNNLNTPNFTGGTPQAFDERPVMPNQKMGFAIEETVTGNKKTGRVRWNTEAQPNIYFAPELPHGSHKIKWFITDNCGNNKEYEYSFTVRDCKAPTVACDPPLTVNVLPAGSVMIHPADVLDFTEDNITPVDQLKLGIRKCGNGTGFPVNGLGEPVTSLNFTCSDTTGMQCVELWSIDKAGNASFCEATVLVEDNGSVCVSGNGKNRVITELGVGISDVTIDLRGNCPFCPPFSGWITDSMGYYTITNNVPIAADFDLVPEKLDNPLNGVTTFDLVLISKHIIALEPLNSPYKMIAADANKSGSVTSFDIVELRKLILGIYPQLPNNSSWRFVDSSFVFPNPLNPFQTGFPDTIQLSNPKPYNFIGIKVGDVNNTSVPNFNAIAETRFEGATYFDTEGRSVEAGEVFTLNFSAAEVLEGCQFTLETDDLEVLEILPGEHMSKDNFAWFPQKGLLTMSWETGGKAAFALKMKAQKSGLLREMLRISNQITISEGYKISENATSLPVKSRLELRFGNSIPDFELYQNQPNPFAQQTAVTFQLPESGTATLTIVDTDGKILWSKTGNWNAGLNTQEIELGEISSAGVLYYKLQFGDKSLVRKMVRI